MVENNEVPIGDVEAGEVVDGSLGIVDVLVDNEGGAARVLVGADLDLADGTVLAEDVVHLLAGDVDWQVADLEDPVHLRRQPRVAFSEGDGRHGGASRRLAGGFRFGFGFRPRRNFSRPKYYD